MPKLRVSRVAVLLIFVCLTAWLQYGLTRDQTASLMAGYFVLFGLYVWIASAAPPDELRFWITGSVIIRLSLLVALPNLSEDVYRYIWDGRVWLAGENAFAHVPSEVVRLNLPGLDHALYSQLNSPEYYSVYPPVSQLLFGLIAWLSPDSTFGSVLILRFLVIAAETGTLVLLARLLRLAQRPAEQILWYALNPLVILELSGNVHLEAFLIFFFLLAFYLLLKNRSAWSSLAWVASIGVKLMPILFLPAILPAVSRWRAFRVYAFVLAGLCLLFIPVYWFGAGMTKGVGLFLQKFEFNASIYYLVREYGWWKHGYNTIATSGWKLSLVAGLLILFFAFLPNGSGRGLVESLASRWLTALLIFFLLATTIHPWYVCTLVALGTLTASRFPMVWSALIFLTYAGYSAAGYVEQPRLLFFEYGMVIGYVLFEGIVRARSIRK